MQANNTSCLYQAISMITGKAAPAFMKNVTDITTINDKQCDELQYWCIENSPLPWMTGWGVVEAAIVIVNGAAENANIGQNGYEIE